MLPVAPPAITISKLNIRYKNLHLFDNLDFFLPAQKWTCLLGSSGVGKTTLLRFIAKLKYDKDKDKDTHCSGNIITSDNLPITNRISYISQQDSLMPWLSSLDNVLLGYKLRNHKVTIELKEKAVDLLIKMGLENIINLKPNKLSGGMKQQVALIRTILENRPIILLDEPFSSLDIVTRHKLQNLAAELLANHTVLLVTHDPLEALRLGDYIYTMTGLPAKISVPIKPQGLAPRDPADLNILKQHAALLRLLTNEQTHWSAPTKNP